MEPPLQIYPEHSNSLPLFYLAYYACAIVVGQQDGEADVAMLAHRNGVCLLAPVCTDNSSTTITSVDFRVSTATEKSAKGMKKRLHRNDPNLLRADVCLAHVALSDGRTLAVNSPARCKLVQLNSEGLVGCATNRWHREGWLAIVQLPDHELPATDGTRVLSLAQYETLRGLAPGTFDWLASCLQKVGVPGDC